MRGSIGISMTPFVFHTAESKKLSVIQNKTNFRLTSIGLGIQWLLRSVRIQLLAPELTGTGASGKGTHRGQRNTCSGVS